MLCDISFPSSHLLHRNLQLLVWPAEYGILILDGYIGYISMAHAEKSPFWLFKSPGAGGLSFQSHQWWFIPRRKEMDELCKITPVISGSGSGVNQPTWMKSKSINFAWFCHINILTVVATPHGCW